jgi:3'(2'), 5'-bisphosphate nucleotidase
MDQFQNGFEVYTKIDGSPVTSADLAASQMIASILSQTKVPIIGEELEKDSFEQRKNWPTHWSVDPLDGTKMFLAKKPEFAVNIAFMKGSKPVFGIISDPTNGLILFGGDGIAPTLLDNHENFQQLKDVELNDPIAVSCSRGFKITSGNHFLDKVAEQFGDYQLLKKSSSLKFFDLAEGKSDIYPRFAPTMEWDISAGHAILNAMGGTIIDADTKEELTYNKESLFNPNFIATRRQVKLEFE